MPITNQKIKNREEKGLKAEWQYESQLNGNYFQSHIPNIRNIKDIL